MSDLTQRELMILKLLEEGCRTSEISKRLSLSYREVAKTIRDIKDKNNVSEVSELLKHYRTITKSDK